jgi:hypothetical protein
MSPAFVEDFAIGLIADNVFLAQSVAAGESVTLGEALELAAGTRALYDLTTLASRDVELMEDCFVLWRATASKFEELCKAWAEVPEDGEIVSWHRIQLQRLRALAIDRVDLYQPAGPGRRRLLAHKAADV